MELTVSMLVAAIVVMIAYTAYRIISNGYLDFTKKNQELGILISLDGLLKKDFGQATLVLQIAEGVYIQKERSQVLYKFYPGEIIRESVITDTFKVEVTERSALFEGSAVNGFSESAFSETLLQDTLRIEASRVDQLDLTIRFRSEDIPYSYHKAYSSQNLIQRKAHAIN